MDLKSRFGITSRRRAAMARGYVVPEPGRCVQCGICSYYCPVEIDVRGHAWQLPSRSRTPYV